MTDMIIRSVLASWMMLGALALSFTGTPGFKLIRSYLPNRILTFKTRDHLKKIRLQRRLKHVVEVHDQKYPVCWSGLFISPLTYGQ